MTRSSLWKEYRYSFSMFSLKSGIFSPRWKNCVWISIFLNVIITDQDMVLIQSRCSTSDLDRTPSHYDSSVITFNPVRLNVIVLSTRVDNFKLNNTKCGVHHGTVEPNISDQGSKTGRTVLTDERGLSVRDWETNVELEVQKTIHPYSKSHVFVWPQRDTGQLPEVNLDPDSLVDILNSMSNMTRCTQLNEYPVLNSSI
jgi:hypothetical protein